MTFRMVSVAQKKIFDNGSELPLQQGGRKGYTSQEFAYDITLLACGSPRNSFLRFKGIEVLCALCILSSWLITGSWMIVAVGWVIPVKTQSQSPPNP